MRRTRTGSGDNGLHEGRGDAGSGPRDDREGREAERPGASGLPDDDHRQLAVGQHLLRLAPEQQGRDTTPAM